MNDMTAPARLGLTPWQTVGPFFHYALPWDGGEILAREGVQGERIVVRGRVLDADGAPIPDALVEIWQANAAGRYDHPEDCQADRPIDPAFTGFGRCPTDDDGMFAFHTVRPGQVPGPGNSMQAPHIALGLFGRGLLRRLVTRIYFPESEGNAVDPILGLVEPDRVGTLMATREGEQDGMPVYRFDIHIQGANETVFFDV
ncbi:protocatechuate 3,4-dioxygenase subunit alpha [Gluconacetobacter liquefaciens]|uniref:Protocatechuate 3,4-dioxygenase alpha subunit n=1 Tax=Gluconacetobacter liquefaciens TaxID=89584 RepID=A0A370G1A4_GLULI|nr:protocatechuate 3,4-dioxygenase subunit alpha [Gluconacetobacter liquefaciens]MBB2187036.1 protocatechuate 3,4-dioxygenase subunit alpha [Gluconacetobacter liquefaciens]RDI37010.1 protocatechuate 3,4-dioxygenase alpha subunit [Gluconacetobacter liquefaciens]GBQ97881.1 protocatechuate 3,4-dioxygenase beta subunit [Gluconacetobacter liquefaciens NRIC 0522]GEB38727.1 protocatechuate 3,4-dioxygenase subunit alpha [Gluconacetobacter liquefaciens]